MCTCIAVNRRSLTNITNMEDQSEDTIVENVRVGVDQLHDVKGVTSLPTPGASSLPAEKRQSHSTGENINGKICTKTRINNTGKFGSGSGSGDQDGCHEDGKDIAVKKRKTRRGKPKHKKLKPYSKQQRLRLRWREKIGRQPTAPYNTTQFLMNDHTDLPDLDQKLSEAVSTKPLGTFQKPSTPSRTRDSSFSVDSDKDHFYSSPEDEEEFLTKEFSTAYEDLHAERLNTLTKSELIQEYLLLEGKIDLLSEWLCGRNFEKAAEEKDAESQSGSTDSESTKKLKLYQQRIDDLVKQNEQLKRENETLRAQTRTRSPVSSVDSESDSESDTDSTSNGNNKRKCDCPVSSCSSSSEESSEG